LISAHVRPEAALDIAEAAGWYESQRPGLGIEFILEADAAISRASENPQHYNCVHEDVRRVLMRRFPYGVYFIWRTDRVDMFAVLHQRRTTKTWQSRLE
jgi:plasmid stabilization system protein ParE